MCVLWPNGGRCVDRKAAISKREEQLHTFVAQEVFTLCSMIESTYAFISTSGFEHRNGVWVEKGSGARFDKTSGEFSGVESLGGFDTFWYNFSLNNPETLLLE